MSARQFPIRRPTDRALSTAQRAASDRSRAQRGEPLTADPQRQSPAAQRPMEAHRRRAWRCPLLPPLHPDASATTTTTRLPTQTATQAGSGGVWPARLSRGVVWSAFFFSLLSRSLLLCLLPPFSHPSTRQPTPWTSTHSSPSSQSTGERRRARTDTDRPRKKLRSAAAAASLPRSAPRLTAAHSSIDALFPRLFFFFRPAAPCPRSASMAWASENSTSTT